jgi:preprotein translocase subunit SecA
LRTNKTVPSLSLSKLLRVGEGRMVKRLKHIADHVSSLSPEVEDLTDERPPRVGGR